MHNRALGQALKLAKWRALNRLAQDRSGATAVEFGLIAAPFFALLLAVLQTSLIFFASQVLETGVSDAARLVRTGQALEQEMDAQTFKEAVCNEVFGLFDCMGGLKVDVRTFEDFNSAQMGKAIEDGELKDDFIYDPGVGGDIVVVRAFYEWPIVFPLMGVSVADLNNGNYLLSAATTFRNEPF